MMFLKFLFLVAVVACDVRADDTPDTATPPALSSVNETSAPVTEYSITTSSIESSAPVSSTVGTLSSEKPSPETSTSETQNSAGVNATFNVSNTSTSVPVTPVIDSVEAKKNLIDRMSTQVIDILKHFENPEPVGFPGQTVLEDPLMVPNTTTNLGAFSANFHNITVHGLSNFTVEAVNTDIDKMEVYMMIKLKRLLITGSCLIETFIGIKSRSPLNITLTNVTAEGTVSLRVEPDGRVVANKSASELTYETLSVSNTLEGMQQSVVNGAGQVMLLALKPYILSQIDERITREVNTLLRDTPRIPSFSEMSPIDLAIVEGRKLISRYYEPFEIQKVFDHDSEFLAVRVGPVRVRGLSHFSRVGTVTVKMVNSTLQIGLRVVTGRLFGRCFFFYDFGKVNDARNGTADFTVERLQFEAKINQSANLRKKPILDDLQLETGKIAVRLDGAGKLDYFVQLGMEFLPQMLRYIIIDNLEEPIKQKIQTEVLDKLDVNQIVQDQLGFFESLLLNSSF